jgi:ADP-heptose:LPS heptosyltransferase
MVFSGIHRFMGLFRGSPSPPQQVRTIVAVQMAERGAAILAHSALVKLTKLFPSAQLYYVIFEEMQDSIRLLGVIPKENILTIDSKSLSSLVVSTVKMLVTLRRQKVDAVLDLELFSRLSILLSYLLGAPIRVGFDKFHMEGLYRGSLHTHRVIYNHLKHISSNFLSLAYALREDSGDIPLSKVAVSTEDIHIPQIVSTPDEQERMLAKLQKFCPGVSREKTIIVVNPNGSELLPLRRWPMENYIALGKKLLEDPALYIVLTGSKSERNDAVMISDALQNERCINLAGETTFRELVDLYTISNLLVSNDSGPPNLASMTKIKVLVFFGPETPVCYKPLGENVEALYAGFMCSPCVSAYNHRKSACRDNKCLQAITVDEVFARIQEKI